MIYEVRQFFFLILGHFCPLPPPPTNNPEHQNFEKNEKSIWRCHHFKLVQQETRLNDV